ncbi:MAG TPA: queuosine salvage family protein [Myxococcota bacterium]
MSAEIFEGVRRGAARVVERARSVSIDANALEKLTRSENLVGVPPDLDPIDYYVGAPEDTAAYILTLDAINFGSGYFPYLAKRPGHSGYFTIAASLREDWERKGPWNAGQLAATSAGDCARLMGQDAGVPEVAELMSLFSRALKDLGEFLLKRFDGEPTGPIVAANRSAARLAESLIEMPLYRDVSHYAGFEAPFYKRAQLTSADLAAVFDGEGYGAFEDLDQLTIFADNLVPHVLRRDGVLVYAPALAARIEAGVPLEAGSPEEVEIRAAAVHSVECCVALMREAGVKITAHQLDRILWTRGQLPAMKAHPRHRARTTNY